MENQLNKRLREVLEGRGENYILPFFWQHGESEALLREGMAKISEAGIGAVCVESRPHPDFAGPGWWRDLDIVMDEARKRGMWVWVLDDAHFPSGYANGKISPDSPYGKQYLDCYQIDVKGPLKDHAFMLRLKDGQKLQAVTAGKKHEGGEKLPPLWRGETDGWREAQEACRRKDASAAGEPDGRRAMAGGDWCKAENSSAFPTPVQNRLAESTALMQSGASDGCLSEVQDLTALADGDLLFWDVPEGAWTLTVIYSGAEGPGRPGYINALDRDAVRFFIDEVYEPHYWHYKQDFGSVFAGFFSDEPELGNVMSGYGQNARVGVRGEAYPWCAELEALLREKWGARYGIFLTGLWNQIDGVSQAARLFYMDRVSGLYGENFCGQIGEWCRSHGVEYIGHVIEDNGCHSRMAYGTGHFFKALWGQDMSGIDVVLQQIRPGMSDDWFHNIGGKGEYNGEFFHYGLAKMGASLGHLDAKKRGRTMCELFGAYGWAEGLKLMKWLADHMLVRGVNWFVPHAFTMKDFPDLDCPPHFYARGMNPQYPYFKYLMQYMNRVSHLISGGLHVPVAGVFYPVCAEWAGDCEPFETVGSLLMRAQIDYELVPEMALEDGAVEKGSFTAGRERLHALLVPWCQYLPARVVRWLEQASAAGLPVAFMHERPRCAETGEEISFKCGQVLASEMLVRWMREQGLYELRFDAYAMNNAASAVPEADNPDLRYYHYRHADGEFYLFFNESTEQRTDVVVHFCGLGGGTGNLQVLAYDAWDNRLETVAQAGQGWHLRLEPGEATVWYVASGETDGCSAGEKVSGGFSEDVNVQTSSKFREQKGQRFPWVADAAGRTCGEPETDCPGKALVLNTGWALRMTDYRGEVLREADGISLEKDRIARQYPYFSGTMDYSVSFALPDFLANAVQEAVDSSGEETFLVKASDSTDNLKKAFGCVDNLLKGSGCIDKSEKADCADKQRQHRHSDVNTKQVGTEENVCARLEKRKLELDLGEVYETAELWLNGAPLGVRIAPPYRFAFDASVLRACNHLEIRVTNTLVHAQRDIFSMTMPVEPSGLLGPVKIGEAHE